MARKKKQDQSEIAFSIDKNPAVEQRESNEEKAEPPSGEQVKPAAKAAQEKDYEVIALRVKDGEIDFGSMREKTRAKVVSVLRQNAPKFAPETTAQTMPQFTMKDVKAIYKGLGSIEAFIAKNRGVPPDIADSVFDYGEIDVAILAEPTLTVLNKRVPDFLMKWKEEVILAVLLTTIHQAKFAMARKMVDQQKIKLAPKPIGIDEQIEMEAQRHVSA